MPAGIANALWAVMLLPAPIKATMFYAAYIRTCIERDVRDLTRVGDEGKFIKFMTAIASRTGQHLNQAAIARDVGVSQPTVERWLSILRASNLVYLLPPYFPLRKRI